MICNDATGFESNTTKSMNEFIILYNREKDSEVAVRNIYIYNSFL